MTSEQSKKLNVGDHVYFNAEQSDHGRVTEIQARYVTVKWDDGHVVLLGHNQMQRIADAASV